MELVDRSDRKPKQDASVGLESGAPGFGLTLFDALGFLGRGYQRLFWLLLLPHPLLPAPFQ